MWKNMVDRLPFLYQNWFFPLNKKNSHPVMVYNCHSFLPLLDSHYLTSGEQRWYAQYLSKQTLQLAHNSQAAPVPAREVFTDLGNGYIIYVESENEEEECRFLYASEKKQVQLQSKQPRLCICAHPTKMTYNVMKLLHWRDLPNTAMKKISEGGSLSYCLWHIWP